LRILSEKLKKIYEYLNLEGFSGNEKIFKNYVSSQKNVRTHNYILTEEVKSKVSSRWGFVFKEFGYELL